jgi:hypothetical protein
VAHLPKYELEVEQVNILTVFKSKAFHYYNYSGV